MRTAMIVPIVCALGIAVPSTAGAQAPPSLTNGPADSGAAQAPAAPQASAPAPAPGLDESRSLFDETWRQFQIGGRFTGVDGDPARFQRYQDLRSGVLFTDARYGKEDSGGNWLYRVAADNVGYRDQRYFGEYERTGKFHITGLWDEIPQFYSVDTKTAYSRNGNPLLLDDAAQRAAQNGAGLSVYPPISPQFDLMERRDTGKFNLRATPTPNLDVTAAFTSTRHRGELPWGGSFGFSNDVEVALPYDSRTNDLTLGTEWTNGRQMLRVAYDGSWFNNLDDTLTWDSPLRLTDSSGSGPGSGRMALWPTNSAQTVSAAGYSKFAHRTQITGFISFGVWNNNQPLLPFTVNSALPAIALPRTTAEADAHVFTTNLNLVSRPATDWEFTAHAKVYDYNNNTPSAAITKYVAYDTSVGTSVTGGPELYAHNRTTFDADATYTGVKPVALNIGYTRNNAGYDERIFASSGENVLRLSADAMGTQWATFHAKYEYGSRTGSDLNQNLLVQIGEQPDMRHYDLADRNRNQFTGIIDFVPDDRWTFSVSGGVGTDDYPDTNLGLQHTTFRTVSVGADFHDPNSGISAGGSYNLERYSGLQRSRSASSDPSQFNDPNRNWTADSAETVNYFSIYVSPPKLGEKTEARLSYDFSYAEGSYLYTVVAGGPLPPPSQLPNVYNKLQQLHLEVRHRLSHKLVLTGTYLYEPFRVYDFAFDPSVVNGIVQPSSLVLGYVYRPYTANSGMVGLRYYW
jgi:MtrB/PioB family decaheme-associated outer membrane protein